VSRGKIIAGVVVLLTVAAVVGGVVYSSAAGAVSVTTAKATTETLGVVVTASGKIEGAHRSDVYPPAAGTLASVKVSDGETVTAGQTLAVMDTSPLKLQVRQAASALAAARSSLDAVERGVPSAVDRAAASASLGAAKSAYDAAKSAYSAFKGAYDSAPAATQASMEATLTQLLVAEKSAYASVEGARSAAGKLSAAARVTLAKRAATLAVTSAKSAYDLARDTLSSATLTAPIDGVVVFNATGLAGTDGATPKAEKGSALTPGTAPFTVTDLSDVSFDAQVDEADIAKVSAGMVASITLDAYPDTSFSGTVSAVRATAVQTTTGGIAFPVLISVDGSSSRLLVGMSGSTDIQVSAVSGALTVPIEAVLDDGSAKYVFVLTSSDTVTKTKVVTGTLTDTSAQITSGISAGDTVVTSQLTSLSDGMTVKPQ
jgi:RND family efflux transporter MFP subunit